MFDLTAMKEQRQEKAEREPVKTYLTPASRQRLRAAAAFTGWHEYEIIEALIQSGLPDAATI